MANWWDEFYSTKSDQPNPKGAPGLAALLPQPQQPPSFDDLVARYSPPSPFDAPAAPPAQLPALPSPPTHQPGFDLANSAGALWEGATQQLVPGFKSALAQAYTGLDRPDTSPEWATRWMAEGRAAQEQADARNEELRKTGKLDSTSEAIRQAIPSLGFSGVTMLGSIPAGIGTGLAAGAATANPIAAGVAGSAAAGAVGGALGYRMAGSQLMNDSFAALEQESQKSRGRGLTEQEKRAAYDALLPVAQNTGLWEAGPEAIGNAAMFGLGKVALGLMPKEAMANLAKSAFGRLGVRAGAGAAALGTEVGTEGVTQFAQGNDQQRSQAIIDAILAGQDPNEAAAAVVPQYQGAAGLWQATKDVAPATIATVLMMGGIAKPIHMAGSAIQARREGKAAVSDAEAATADLRANLDLAREPDILEALQGYDAIEQSRNLPAAAAERLNAARRQLMDELQLRASPEALAAPLDSPRGMAGYLGFAGRANELDDAAVQEAAARPLAPDAPPELIDARTRYQRELQVRQGLTQAADYFQQNPAAVDGVAKVLGDIAAGKPLAKGAHGSVDYNLASLSDDQLMRYQRASDVLLRDHGDALGNARPGVEKALGMLGQEAERRAAGERRDPQAIREADVAERVAKTSGKALPKLLAGLSPDALDRMAAGLDARAGLEPGLADTARAIRQQAQQERLKSFNPQGQQPPAAPQQGQQENLKREVADLNQQPPIPAPGLPSLPAGPVVPNIQNPQPYGQNMLAAALARQQAERNVAPAGLPPVPALPQWGGPPGATERPTQPAPSVGPAFEPPVLSGSAELGRLLGPQPAPSQRQTPSPARSQSLGDLLNQPSRLGVVPPAPARAQGPLSPNAIAPQAKAQPPVGLPAGPKGASGARQEGTGAQQGSELGAKKVASEVVPITPSQPGASQNAETVRVDQGQGRQGRKKGQPGLRRGAVESGGDLRQPGQDRQGAQPAGEVAPGKVAPQAEGKRKNDRYADLAGKPIALVNSHFAAGVSSHDEGKPRELPSYLLDKTNKNAKEWLKGWDAARAKPITPETTPRNDAAIQLSQETPDEKGQAETEAALLKQEPPASPGAVPTPTKKPSRASRSAPSWNDSTRAEREAILKDTGASDAFAQRKANEWTTWDAIPEGPIKKRIRDVLVDRAEEAAAPLLKQGQNAPAAEAVGQPAKATGSRALSESIKAFLLETPDLKLNYNQFWGMANEAFGGSQAQGAYNSKDAYDAMELGLNLAVLADENASLRGQESDQVRAAIGYLEEMQNRLPTQTKRDDEQQKMQQFSTPHTHAHVVAWVAGIGENDVVLEPTAGIGNLVVHAKLMGAREIVANELSKRRDALLRQIPGVRVLNENANHLNAVLPADVKPTVVVMNPPFSADVNLPGKKDLGLGATHIEQALARLQPGGRLVAIVGRGMAMDAPRFKQWWNDIEKRYNVRANIAISGKEYTKFGTSFDNRILVIDKTGQTGLRSNIVQGEVSRVEALVDRLWGVRRERVEQYNAAGATGQTGVDRTENPSGAGQSVSAATAQEGSGESGTVSGVAAGSSRLAGRAGRSGRNAGTGARPDHSGSGANRGRGVRSDQPGPDAGGVDSGTGVPAENQPERTGRAAQEVGELEISGAIGPTDAEGFGTSAFESYRPTTSFKSAKPHPTPLSESAAMGSVKFPPLNYSPKLPADVVNEGRLSAAQLETVAYAGQAHEQILPNGERRGFFVGDGTGVGKGAQIAGIILDNWNRGRKKAVWISENSPLFADAQRDAEWVGLGKDRLLLQGKIKGEIGAKEGVLFTTYSTLTNSEKDKDGKPGVKRIDQIIAWLGKDFDGVIAFDEAHSMSNALQSKGSRGTVKPSQTALTGIELQKALPKARVVYVSATGATEVRNLVYASRLGLWGEGTAFGSAIDFVSDINSGGLAAMEVVAKDMKAMGAYTARSLSYDGVEVEQLAHELSPEQAKTYDELARAWQITLANVDAAMEASGAKGDSQARSSALSGFWGAHQRFFNAVLTALSAPSLLADAKRQLDAGRSVIMQLVNTDEATMKRRLAQASDTGQNLEELDLTPRDVLMQYLQHSFPTTLYEPYIDDNGNEGVRPVVDASGNVVQDPDAIARRDRLLENLATLKVPESILDQIINHFGSDAVAEITGRSKRIVRRQDGTAKMEKLGEAKRRGDAADFDNGKRRILVFSDAGGTGRSYHADLRIPNQQKRVHYLVQPGWRADKAIQGLGRSHRTNQAQPPLFKTVTTTIKSQARFVSSIARRMNQMGALTKGQRDATSGQGMFDDDMNLENEYSQQALVSLFHAIAHGKVQGITVADIEQQMGIRFIDAKTGQILKDKIPNIQRFLNRLLSLDIAMMDRVFDEFDTRRRNNIEYAKQHGFYDQGMETLQAISVKKDEDVVAIAHPGGSTTRYVKLTVTRESKLLPFDSLHPDAFFARNKSSGKLYAFEPATSITNPETGELIERVRRVSPDSVRYMPVREAEDREKYDRLDLTKSQKKTEWAKATEATPKTYDQTMHLVSGALLPVWDRLPRDGSSRVIRAQTDTKERLIGRVIENKSLKETLTRLNVSRDAPKLDGRQAIDAIVQNNATIELANGWKLVRRTVNNQPRIEVLNVAMGGDRSVLLGMGAFSEIINYQSRLFLPSDNANILDRLFASKPVVDVVEPSIRRSAPSSKPVKPATIDQARSNLKRAVGADLIDGLEKSGKLVFHESDPTGTGAAGFVDRNGIIHLMPANMDQDAASVLAHEAVHIARDDRFAEGDRNRIRLAHAVLGTVGLRNFIGNPGFTDLAQQVRRMAAEGDRTAQEALAKAKREDPNNIDEEAIAYLAQYADERLPLVRRILAAIRAALYRMGIKVQLTPADVRALAVSALKNHARQVAKTAAMAGQRQEAFSLPDFAPTEADKAEVERQMKAVKEIRDGQGRLLAPNGKPSNLNERQWKQVRTQFFKRWFGDWENDPANASKVVDENGEPMVVYRSNAVNSVLSGKSQIPESGMDGLRGNAKLLANLFKSPSFRLEGLGGFDTPTQRVVIAAVRSFGLDPKILGAVVKLVPVDVVHILAGEKTSADSLFSDDAVLKKFLSVDSDGSVSTAVDVADSLISAIARMRAETPGEVAPLFDGSATSRTNKIAVFLSAHNGIFQAVDAGIIAQKSNAIGNAGTFSNRSARIDYSQPTTTEDAAEQERLWQEFQAVRAQFQAKEAMKTPFARWFGDGIEGITARDGKPIALYHGTSNPTFNQWDASRVGQATRQPTAGLGFFMTADRGAATRFGSNVLELNARINKPYYLTDADLWAIDSLEAAAKLRGKLQAQGYDGAVLAEPGMAPYVIVFNSNQAKFVTNENPTESPDFRYSRPASAATDAEYLAAIERDDMKTAQRMVDEAARNAGYDTLPLWRFDSSKQPTVFDSQEGGAIYLSKIPQVFFQKDGVPARKFYIKKGRIATPKDVEKLGIDEMRAGDISFLSSEEVAALKRKGFVSAAGPLGLGKGRDEFAVFDPAHIKSADPVTRDSSGNVIPLSQRFDKTTPDIRYSRPGRPPRMDSPRMAAKVLGDIGEVRDALKPGERLRAKADPRNFAQQLSDLKSNTRPAWLGLLTRNMQLELAREVLPPAAVSQFGEAAEAMDAYESRMIQSEGFPLAERWQNLMVRAKAQADRLSHLLYLSTWTGVDPRKAAPKGKGAAWARAKAAYDSMTDPEARALYGDVLAFYEGQTQRLLDELLARIDRHSLPEPDRRAMKDTLRQEFERMRLDGPYVPLMRFGDLSVFAEPRTSDEKPVFSFFETVQEQRAFADWLKGEGYRPQLGVKTDEIAKRAMPSNDMVEKLAAIVDKTTKGPQAQVLKDAMYQLFLRSLPEQSIRKHFIHRRFIPGYSADALRTFATFARRSAKQIARLAHSDRLSDALDDMAASVKSGKLAEPVAAGHLVKELDKTFQWMMNPTTNTLASRLTHLGFLWHLGASPAHFFLNLSQQAQVSLPWLAGELHGKIGGVRVATELAKANKDFIASNPFVAPAKRSQAATRRRTALEGEFGGDMGRALKLLEQAGKTDKTQTYSLAGLSEEDSWLWSRPYLRKFTQGTSWFFHVAEVINREATAIAAYRLGRKAGMGHDAAYDLARRAIDETHFDYTPCVDTETEILTTDGWKTYQQISAGDRAISIDSAGKAIEIEVNAVNIFEGEHDVIEFGQSNRRFSMVLTPNHDAIVQRFDRGEWKKIKKRKAYDLKKDDHVLRVPLSEIEGRAEKYGEDLAALIGWIAAEGWYGKYRNCKTKRDVRIAQSLTHNSEYVDEIEGILDRLGGHYRRYLCRNDTFVYYTIRREISEKVQEAIPDKILTWELVNEMSPREMRALIDAFAKGDGNFRGATCRISQKDRRNLDVLQAMSVLCGVNATLADNGGCCAHLHLHISAVSSSKRSFVKHLTRENKTVDTVWCPTTENGIWIARRNGAVFVTGNSNRARFMRGNVAKVLTLFKQYSLNVTWQLGRNLYLMSRGASPEVKAKARTKLLGMLGMTAIMAGAAGLPLYGEIMWLITQAINAGRDDDEPEYDADTELRTILGHALGKTGSTAVRHGLINAFAGIDLSSRVKLDDLLWRSDERDLEGKQLAYAWMEQGLGPVAGLFVRGVSTVDGLYESLVTGENASGAAWKSVEGALPKALKDISRSIRYAREGATTARGATVMPAERFGAMESVGQALGFVPAELAERYDVNRSRQNLADHITRRRRALVDMAAMAIQQNDDEAKTAVMEDIAAFNKRYPTVAITGETLRKSLQSRAQALRETEAAGGIRVDRKLLPVVMQGD